MQIIPLRLRISSAFLIIGQRPLLVDSGQPGDLPALTRLLRAAGVAPQDLSLVIHTHAHYDHCGCTRALVDLYGLPAAIHAGDLAYLCAGRNVPFAPGSLMARLAPLLNRTYPGVQPARVIDTPQFDLRPYGLDGYALHTPGHTPGSLTVVVDGAGAIAGDLLSGGSLFGMFAPQRPSYPPIVLDRAQLHASVARVLAANPTCLYVGHGGPLQPDAVRAWLELQHGVAKE